MTPQELKNSILQLAIQGKLVEQRPEEGTAEELYAQIQAEKQKLIKAGKIKKEKPLPEITEEEIPFEIPKSWKWVRHNDLFSIVGGSQPPKSQFSDVEKKGYTRLYQIRDYGEKPVPVYVPIDKVSKFTDKGDILLARYGGSLGKVFWAKKGAYNVAMAKPIKHFEKEHVNKKYLYWYYNAPLYQSLVKYNSRSAQGGFNKEDLNELLFPFPPCTEQKRIVAKIDELLPYIERYAEAWSKLEEFNKRFPEDMQKSILQMAIQGKLVEQRPEEGTAEELYDQIQAEKQKLIKAGKIKKEKPLQEIAEDEIPFEIPESWKWCRLKDIAKMIIDCPHSTPKYFESPHGYYAIDTTCIDADGNITGWRYVSEDDYISRIARGAPREGDIVYTREGSICRAAIIPGGKKICLGQRVMLIRKSVGISARFLKIILMAPQTVAMLTAKQKGIGAKHVNVVDVCNLVFPLPPLQEQERIIKELDDMLPLCIGLK